jgi:5-methylthioadenosine/S-adenosylhomocysteine deaminase
MSSVTLVHARWVVPIIPKDTFYENYTLVLDGRKIQDLLPTSEAKKKYTNVKEVDLSEEHVLMPGISAFTKIRIRFGKLTLPHSDEFTSWIC